MADGQTSSGRDEAFDFLGAFVSHALLSPGTVAVVQGESRVTYGDLLRRVESVAAFLGDSGVTANTLVGVCMDRSVDAVAGILGILRAGGAYVPMDPAYPAERLAHMVRDSGVHVVLTSARAAEAIPPGAARLVRLDSEWEQVARSRQRAPTTASPDSLMYAIYTSGSTGQPKGSLVFRRGFANLMDWYAHAFGFGPDSCVLLMSSLSFDLTQKNIYAPLATGGRLILLPGRHYDPDAILAAIAENSVTSVNCTPSAFAGLLQSTDGSAFRKLESLRHVFLGGEPIPVGLLRPWTESGLCRAEIVNTYGPTECTDVVAYHRLADLARYAESSVPIGRAVPGCELLVLDAGLAPVVPGEDGELCIGGVCVGGGYLHRDELTAERFRPHPSPAIPGGRLYRTGDRVRLLPDGEIEFLGRMDTQVKIRGHRVELAEIDHALEQHPSVRQAVCLLREDSPGVRRLTAYVVARDSQPSVNALRAFLENRLPGPMQPEVWVFLGSLPLTAHGKIDRQALPVPARRRPDLASAPLPPRTPTEGTVAGLWRQTLGLDEIGVRDGFFDLGGHSLLAVQTAARLRETFGVPVGAAALFEHPTVETLSAWLDHARAQPQSAGPRLEPVPRDGAALPLSFAEQRLWFLDAADPGTPLYNLPAAYRLTGPLDADRLRESLRVLAARHEALRTTYRVDGDRPVRVIAAAADPDLPVTDLSSLPAGARPAQLDALLRQESDRPFDLAVGPLTRTHLVKLGPAEHVLFFVAHHNVFDGLSFPLWIQDLAGVYSSLARGRTPDLPVLPVQYADFAVWQRRWMEGDELDRHLAYWRQHLAGCAPVLDLPADRPRPPVRSHRGAEESLLLPAELAERLRDIARAEGCTQFMALLAVFSVLLSRYTGQEDLLVGSPVACRDQPETERVIGFFVNTVVLRARLDGGPDFRELLRRVKETCVGAYRYQHMPFERLVDEFAPRRDPSRTPLFQVMFSFDEQTDPVNALGDVALEAVDIPGSTSIVDLWLMSRATSRGLAVTLAYSSDLFVPQTARSMLEHFRLLVEGVVADPARPVCRLPLLTPGERSALAAWNRTQAEYPRELCAHQVVEAQAARTPDAPAVVHGTGVVTYRRLDARANRIARHLQALGVAPGVRVGLCLRRSADMVAALLGVLKAGGAYVPLDPDYPPERLKLMLEDSQAAVLLTEEALHEEVEPGRARVVCIDGADRGAIAAQGEDRPECAARPGDAAYVIYTSGSTGRPKGVCVHHRALVNFLAGMRREPGLAPEDVLLAVTTLSFDIAALELLLPLTVGARIVVADREVAVDGPGLLRLLRESRATVMQATPATWRLLVGSGWGGDLRIRVLCGGEAMPPDLLPRLLERAAAVWNLYGPTETTVWSTCCRLNDAATPIPIGRPIANTFIYILDRNREPVPIGVPGELCIGGHGVSLGYLNRPDLTARAFEPDPFSGEDGGRLYHTGDLARFRRDGVLECLGRMDHQVKVRGFRIELGEIEAVLSEHPTVAQAAATVREDTPGDQRLAAYLVVRGGGSVDAADLRAHLRRKLPDYMIPQHFVPLPSLPLTPAGKIDRRALPAPPAAGAGPGVAAAVPLTETESVLAAVWTEILGTARLSASDNFFDIGGHSLLATRLVLAAGRRFGIHIALRSFLQAPTLGAMARMVEDLLLADVEKMSESEARSRVGRGGES